MDKIYADEINQIRKDYEQKRLTTEQQLQKDLDRISLQERNSIILLAMIAIGVPIIINLVGLFVCYFSTWWKA